MMPYQNKKKANQRKVTREKKRLKDTMSQTGDSDPESFKP
jgi:hypothetical protein